MPNIHPMIVHFPIVLFFFGILTDVAGNILRKKIWLPKLTNLLYAFGCVSGILAYITGRIAFSGFTLPEDVAMRATAHMVGATLALVVFIILTLSRFLIYKKVKEVGLKFTIPLLLVGLLASNLLLTAALRGGELVFKHGVGIQTSETIPGNRK